MARPVLLQQWRAVIDRATTVICLHAAGQVRPVGEDFETLAGDFPFPPAHVHCRAVVTPFMYGFVNDMRQDANRELRNRPLAQRRLGPGGEVGGSIPPPAHGFPPRQGTRRRGAGMGI